MLNTRRHQRHRGTCPYLFLVTVADAQGLSYYSETSIAKRLSMLPARVDQARADLVRLGLIAYESPLHQVLALDAPVAPAPAYEISPQRWRERLDQSSRAPLALMSFAYLP